MCVTFHTLNLAHLMRVVTFNITGNLSAPMRSALTISCIWMFPKIGVPQNGWFIMENLIKMDDLGGTPIFGNTHIGYQAVLKKNGPSPNPCSTKKYESTLRHGSGGVPCFCKAIIFPDLRGLLVGWLMVDGWLVYVLSYFLTSIFVGKKSFCLLVGCLVARKLIGSKVIGSMG